MVSRRNFAAITLMMLVICFLFPLPQYVKETTNPYAVNIYSTETMTSGSSTQWEQPELTTAAQLNAVDSYILLIGDRNDDVGYAVSSWCKYTKSALAVSPSVSAYASIGGKLPDTAVLDTACVTEEDESVLERWNQQGVTLIFAGIPDAERLQQSEKLQDLIGVHAIEQDRVELTSIRMFSGFLLGGEVIYGLNTELDQQLMDLELTAPWYKLSINTDVYVMGQVSEDILPKQEYRNEQLPALVWRRMLNQSNIFVASRSFLSGNTGIGVLSAMMAEDRPYYLYPVVDAQVLSIANFPGMAAENTDVFLTRYGREQDAVVRDLLWPGLESVSEVNDFRMSCFAMPQYDYQDSAEPDPSLITFYLKMLSERKAEAGISMQHAPEISLRDKWERDMAFIHQDSPTYHYSSAFVTAEEMEEFRSDAVAMQEVFDVSADMHDDNSLFTYLDGDTLCQSVTHDLLEYSFSEDLELRSVETALGYTNIMLNMHRVAWPDEKEPGWEVYYETAGSNLHTYWKRFDEFDRLTISESGRRIRDFLDMNYSDSRTGDVISLDMTGKEATFILRTHLENVTDVRGGDFQKLENNAWLIHAKKPHVEITLKTDEKFQY